eukprot:283396-Chlamydomonas_euryale.AAC.3
MAEEGGRGISATCSWPQCMTTCILHSQKRQACLGDCKLTSSFLAVLYFACASVRRDGGAFTCAQVVLVDSRLAFWQVGDEVEPARQVWHLALLLHFLPHCACLQLAPQRQIRHADGMPDDKRAQCEVVVDAIAHSFEIGAGNDVAVGVIEPVVDLRLANLEGMHNALMDMLCRSDDRRF